MTNNSFIYKYFKYFTSNIKKTCTAVVFSCKHLHNILKFRKDGRDLPAIWKTRFFEICIENNSRYVWKFRITVLQNHLSGPCAMRVKSGLCAWEAYTLNYIRKYKRGPVMHEYLLHISDGHNEPHPWLLKISSRGRVLRKNPFLGRFCRSFLHIKLHMSYFINF